MRKKFINKISAIVMLLAMILSQGIIVRAEEKAVETVDITFSMRDEATKKRFGSMDYTIYEKGKGEFDWKYVLDFTSLADEDTVVTLEKGKTYNLNSNTDMESTYMGITKVFVADEDKKVDAYADVWKTPFRAYKTFKTFIPLVSTRHSDTIDSSYKDMNRADEIFHKDNYINGTNIPGTWYENAATVHGGATYSVYADQDFYFADKVSGIMFHKGERLFTVTEKQRIYVPSKWYPEFAVDPILEFSNKHKYVNDSYFTLNEMSAGMWFYNGKYKIVLENFDASTLPIEYEKFHLDGILPEGKQSEYYIDAFDGKPRMSVVMELDKPTINIKVQKIDDITKKGVPGAKLGVYNKTPINFYKYVGEEGLGFFDALEPGQLLQTITTGEDGYAYVTLDLPAGEFEIRELEPPVGYVKTDEVYIIDAKWRNAFETQYDFDIKIPNKKIVPLTPLEPSSPTKPWTPLVPSKPVIPWTPIVPSNPIAKPDVPSATPESPKTESVNTGDTTNVNGYILLMVAATAFVIYKKKTAK